MGGFESRALPGGDVQCRNKVGKVEGVSGRYGRGRGFNQFPQPSLLPWQLQAYAPFVVGQQGQCLLQVVTSDVEGFSDSLGI